MKNFYIGQIIKETRLIHAGSHGCPCCGQREIYIYVKVLEALENVVCIERLGKIEWVAKEYLENLV